MGGEVPLILTGKSYGLIFSPWRKLLDVIWIGRRLGAAVATNQDFLSQRVVSQLHPSSNDQM